MQRAIKNNWPGGNVYDLFDPAKNYDVIGFRPDRTLQSRELMEVQQAERHRNKGVFDYLLKDGAILRDCTISINKNTGEASCSSGALYVKGAARGVAQSSFVIPLVGTVVIGVYLRERVVSPQEDPSLLNPAVGTRGEGEEGGLRLRVWPEWGMAPQNSSESDNFYPVYTVDDGELRAKEAPPQLDSISTALADYDVESTGGSYVVQGLRVLMAPDAEDGRQVYTIAEGSARVHGRRVSLPVSRRITRASNPDLLTVDSEPFLSTTAERQRIKLDRYPVGRVIKASLTTRSTKTVTKAGYNGSLDPLPDTSVVKIVEVKQGGVIFTEGEDYKLTAGKVDWTPSGLEPDPHSTYTVTYDHIITVTPEDVDLSGYSITGAVAGTQVLSSYTQMLPRLDCLCVTREGELTWVEGVANEWNPQKPRIPEHMLGLATVCQTWDDKRRVMNDGTVMVPMNDLADINGRIDGLVAQMAQQRLASDVNTREAGAKKGLFVDPCLDDSMRDQGREQSAAVLNGVITLPIEIKNIFPMPQDVKKPETLPYIVQAALEQLSRTGGVRINPYDAFDPFPAFIKLDPAIDNWTDVQSSWASPVARQFNVTDDGYYHIIVGRSTSTQTEVLSSSTKPLENLRPISVAFRGEGFGPGENVTVVFDGVPVRANVAAADERGVFQGSFIIPEGIPAGTKEVEFIGSGGNFGSAVFTGQGQLTQQTLRLVTTTVLTWHDPQGQTYALDKPCQLVGVDIWGTKGGTSDIVAQLRETTVSFPNDNVLAEGIIKQSEFITDGGPTRILFNAPAMQMNNVEGSFVIMCTDAESSIAMAELGEWDQVYKRVVTSQPYQIGVNVSSSNNRAWTIHQDRDLTFRLLKAQYTETTRVIDLGEISVDDVTDLMVLGVAEQPTAATRVEYLVTLPETYPAERELTLIDRQPARLSYPVSGVVKLRARLTGTESFSPVLYPGAQLVCGKVGGEATYISRAVPAGQDSRVRVIVDAYVPSGAGYAVAMQEDGTDVWKDMPFVSSAPQDNGWVETLYETTTDALLVRVKLTATGNTQARPMLASPRVLTL